MAENSEEKREDEQKLGEPITLEELNKLTLEELLEKERSKQITQAEKAALYSFRVWPKNPRARELTVKKIIDGFYESQDPLVHPLMADYSPLTKEEKEELDKF